MARRVNRMADSKSGAKFELALERMSMFARMVWIIEVKDTA